jgi:hypothetical protein
LAALRNRENQRRSRARRKDYIQELEQRLRQHEQAGVKATAEVQAAARKVSEENIRLRSLLGICGVDNGRIEEFLRTGDVSFVSKASSEVRIGRGQVTEKCAPMTNCAGTMQTPPAFDTDVCTKVTRPAGITLQAVTPPISNTSSQVSALSSTPSTVEPRRPADEAKSSAPTPGSNVNSPTMDDQYQGQSSGRDEISCMAAAEIIASMRGHDNPEEVWPELGCDSSRKCMVKNMAIFQIMDI